MQATMLARELLSAPFDDEVRSAFDDRATGLDRTFTGIVLLAAFFSVFRLFRIPQANFTLSDALFVLAGLTLLARRGSARVLPLRGSALPFLWISGLTLLTCGLLGSALVNGEDYRAIEIVPQYVFAYGLLPLLLANLRVESAANAVSAYVLGVAAVALTGVAVSLFAPEWGSLFGNNGPRMGSFLTNPNALAYSVALCLPLCVHLLVAGGRWRAGWALAAAALVGGLLVASSFGGLLAALLGIAVLTLCTVRVRHVIRIGLLLTAVVGLYVWLVGVPEVFTARVLQVLASGEAEDVGSYSDRLALAREALRMIANAPFVGLGPGAFALNSVNGTNAHNTLLLLWAEGGLLAPLGFLAMLAAAAFACARNLGRHRDGTAAAAGVAVCAVFAFSLLGQNHVYGRHLSLPLLLPLLLTRGDHG